MAISRKEEVRSYILEAADILKRNVDDIVKDFDDEPISEIYITLRVGTADIVPELSVQKTYIPVNEEFYKRL